MYQHSSRDGQQLRVDKWALRMLAVFTLILSVTGAALASGTVPRGTVRTGRSMQRASSRRQPKSVIDKRVEILTKQLDLNEVQRFDLRKILENGQTEAKRLWADEQVSPIDRMAKLRALRADSQKQFHAVLTEEQRKKYDQYLQKVSQESSSAAVNSASGANPPAQDNGKAAH